MTAKRINKRNVVILNNLNEDEVDSPKSEDEISKMTFALQNELNMSEKSSKSGSEEIEDSENEGSKFEGKFGCNQKLKKKKDSIGLKEILLLQQLILLTIMHHHLFPMNHDQSTTFDVWQAINNALDTSVKFIFCSKRS